MLLILLGARQRGKRGASGYRRWNNLAGCTRGTAFPGKERHGARTCFIDQREQKPVVRMREGQLRKILSTQNVLAR